jgi:hypothetical protein
LGLSSLYDLDRLDMSVKSTLDMYLQKAVTKSLLKLLDPEWVNGKGLDRPRLLDSGPPGEVTYAFTLYESSPQGNLLRVQTDTREDALNSNEGVKLDLGSTAKLRTLIHYLEIIAELHERHGHSHRTEPQSPALAERDPIRHWAASYLQENPSASLKDMLRASLKRSYSADPSETFFTGGGIHHFHNYDDRYDESRLSVREAFLHSVNLVFVRLMRDIVRYHIQENPEIPSGSLTPKERTIRRSYLAEFADFEGILFLRKFYARHRALTREESLSALIRSVRPQPRRLAALYRSTCPDLGLPAFLALVVRGLSMSAEERDRIAVRIENLSRRDLHISDMGFITGIHPLELWLVRYLSEHPGASWPEIQAQSSQVRQDVYGWLFRSSSSRKQNKRIRIMLEREAFEKIHSAWARLGYPFDTLVPSFATAIGTSADCPGALAELMGIIMNDGMKMPSVSIQEISFAEGTPYETHFIPACTKGERVLEEEIARVVREALEDVVKRGTARRLANWPRRAGEAGMVLGGKTGTGDHRHRTFDRAGQEVASEARNRTATFAFLMNDRHFGVITAYVSGKESGEYDFTSSLPLAAMEWILPIIQKGGSHRSEGVFEATETELEIHGPGQEKGATVSRHAFLNCPRPDDKLLSSE